MFIVNQAANNSYLLATDNFTSGLLELAQLTQEVPKARLGHDMIGGEDPHPVQRRIRLLLGRQLASDDFVFL